jgi:hypothetical protein
MKNCKIILLVCALLLTACGLRAAFMGQLDPAYAPKKADPIALVLSDNPSIQDRQVFPLVKEELVKSGFKLVDPNQATWILGVSTHDDTYFSGIKTTKISFGSTEAQQTIENSRSSSLYFWLFAAGPYRDGKRLAVWGGVESVNPDDFSKHPDAFVRALIEIYGKNFYDESERLSKVKKDVDSE